MNEWVNDIEQQEQRVRALAIRNSAGMTLQEREAALAQFREELAMLEAMRHAALAIARIPKGQE